MKSSLPRSLWQASLRFLFPPLASCSLCGTVLDIDVDDGLCPQCLSRMPWIEGLICPRCGLPDVDNQRSCPDCGHMGASFSASRALWRYQADAKTVVHLYKFQKRVHLAHALAELMVHRLLPLFPYTYDVVTYVPMQQRAVRARGYNQARVLAEQVSIRAHIPCQGLLHKAQSIRPQHRLRREDRLQNIEGAFAVASGSTIPLRVLLVDDVVTTGTTVHGCSLALLEAGASEVGILSIAR